MGFPFEFAEGVSTIVATIIAVIALVISVWQLTASNRQSLYSHRLNWITRAAGLVSLYEENRKELLKLDPSEPYMDADLTLVFMTNNVWLERVGAEISRMRDERSRHNTLTVFEDVKMTAMESEMLFRKSVSGLGGRFIYAYEALLEEMRRYTLIIQKMTEYNEKRIGGRATIERASSKIREPRYRDDLLAAVRDGESAYWELMDQGVLARAKKATKVFGFRR